MEVCEKWWASQVAQWLKNPPTMQKTQDMRVWSLGQEYLLEEGLGNSILRASSILAWRIPWTEPGGESQTWPKRPSTHAHTWETTFRRLDYQGWPCLFVRLVGWKYILQN